MLGSESRQYQRVPRAQSAGAGSSETHSSPPKTRPELARKKRRISPHSTGAEWNRPRPGPRARPKSTPKIDRTHPTRQGPSGMHLGLLAIAPREPSAKKFENHRKSLHSTGVESGAFPLRARNHLARQGPSGVQKPKNHKSCRTPPHSTGVEYGAISNHVWIRFVPIPASSEGPIRSSRLEPGALETSKNRLRKSRRISPHSTGAEWNAPRPGPSARPKSTPKNARTHLTRQGPSGMHLGFPAIASRKSAAKNRKLIEIRPTRQGSSLVSSRRPHAQSKTARA